jgi:hypothetical protein
MQCFKCNAENPDAKRFCGDCGAELKSSGPLSDSDLRAHIRSVIRDELADQRVVEVEITERVLGKLSEWGKLLSYFAGIPLAAALLLFGFLGIKKYADLSELASAAESKIGPVIAKAQASAATVEKQTEMMKTESQAIEDQISKLKPKISAIEAESARLAGLEKNFDQKFAAQQASFDKRVSGIQGEVEQIKQSIHPPRYEIRTGVDEAARRVSRTPVDTTIEELVSLIPPEDLRALRASNKRAGPVEFTTYRLEARIVTCKLEHPSGDFALVLQSPSGATMRALVPDPASVDPSSRWLSDIAAVRKQIADKLDPQRSFKESDLKVRITGVGFFNLPHHQRGGAPNAIELHPVLSVEFLD